MGMRFVIMTIFKVFIWTITMKDQKYAKDDIQCHRPFYVTTITFLVTLSMNKFTNTIIPTYFQFIQMLVTETKFGMICILTSLWWNIVMDDRDLDEKSVSKWQHRKIYSAQIFFYKGWQILLG